MLAVKCKIFFLILLSVLSNLLINVLLKSITLHVKDKKLTNDYNLSKVI